VSLGPAYRFSALVFSIPDMVERIVSSPGVEAAKALKQSANTG